MHLAPLSEPLNVVLVEPQIPPNTGNIARLCSATGCRLHLVGPLGFSVADKDMRRAGLDYWFGLWKRLYADRAEFERSLPPDARLHLFTARAERSLWDVVFEPGDYLVFGSEPTGQAQQIRLNGREGSTQLVMQLMGKPARR